MMSKKSVEKIEGSTSRIKSKKNHLVRVPENRGTKTLNHESRGEILIIRMEQEGGKKMEVFSRGATTGAGIFPKLRRLAKEGKTTEKRKAATI